MSRWPKLALGAALVALAAATPGLYSTSRMQMALQAVGAFCGGW